MNDSAQPSLYMGVAAHKPYWMPGDSVYHPVWVGSALREGEPPAGYVRDDGFDGTISAKNPTFCELTGTYWMWKNIQADYVGLCHYRRYFEGHAAADKKARIATGDELRRMLAQAPVLLPAERNYFIETNYSQYVHAHHEEDLAATRAILEEKYPSYLSAYDKSMSLTHGHRFNMFVMRADIFDQYCTWLFDVLFELERRLDISDYSTNDQRVFGFVAERLMDPWIYTNEISFKELPVVNLESQHWVTKSMNFLKRKFVGKKYGKSF